MWYFHQINNKTPHCGKYKANCNKYKTNSNKYKIKSNKYKININKYKTNSNKYKTNSTKYKINSNKYKLQLLLSASGGRARVRAGSSGFERVRAGSSGFERHQLHLLLPAFKPVILITWSILTNQRARNVPEKLAQTNYVPKVPDSWR